MALFTNARTHAETSGRVAITVVLVIFLLVIIHPSSKATDVGIEDVILKESGFGKLTEFSYDTADLDIKTVFDNIITGKLIPDGNKILEILTAYCVEIQSSIIKDTTGILLPVLLSIFARILFNNSNTRSGIQLFCRVSAVLIFAEEFRNIQFQSESLIDSTLRTSEILTPIMVSVLGMTGALTTASLLSPMSSLSGLAISWCFKKVGICLIDISVAIAVSGNISESFRLKRLFKLIKNTVIGLTGALVAGFTALLSIQGLMGDSLDSVTMKGAQYTIENLIPVIGGDISVSMNSIVASSVAVKNAIGISGIVLLVMLCIKPVVRISLFSFLLKAGAAIGEPAVDDCIIDAASQFSDIAQMLLVICIGSILLVTILIGASLGAAGNLVR